LLRAAESQNHVAESRNRAAGALQTRFAVQTHDVLTLRRFGRRFSRKFDVEGLSLSKVLTHAGSPQRASLFVVGGFNGCGF